MIQGDLVAFVQNLSAVKAAKARVFWAQAQDPLALPYIVLTAVGGRRDICHGGTTGGITLRVQCDCVTGENKLTSAQTLRSAVNTALLGIAQTIGSFAILSCIHENDIDFYDGAPLLYRATTDFNLEYRAAP
jgi:hypothetical protein